MRLLSVLLVLTLVTTVQAADKPANADKPQATASPELVWGIFRSRELPGVVVDDRQAEVQGQWKRSQAVTPYLGDGYLHDENQGKGGKSVRFSATLPKAGKYQVLLVYSPGSNRATNTPVEIQAADGSHQVKVDQRQAPEIEKAFHLLGVFPFAADKPAVVTIGTADTDGHVIADAVQFLPEGVSLALKQPVKKPAKRVDPKKKEDPKKEEPEPEPEITYVPPKKVLGPTITVGQLDELIAKQMGDAKPAEAVSDEQFLRRLSLDLIGRQPTPQELNAWMADKAADRYDRAIERLLASPEFGQNWANYWSDTISYRTPPPELTYLDYSPFKNWLAEQLNQNATWDDITREILMAKGKIADAPAASFIGYHEANATRLAAETARVFLGQQIRCAECHDHPFDHWKREEFHQLTAFFARTSAKLPWNDGPQTVVSSKEKGEYMMPNAADPKKKGTMMTPTFLVETGLGKGSSDDSRRRVLADLITSQENPWFAKAFVNRIWQRLMGRGFYEPVDDMAQHNEAVLPEVHDALANSFERSGFDVKHVFRVITGSQAYRRQLRLGKAVEESFATAEPTQLRGDEVWASLVTAVQIPNVTPPKRKPTGDERFPPPPKSTRDLVAEAFGFDPSTPLDAIPRTMAQAMLLMNNKQVQAQVNGSAEADTTLSKLLSTISDDRQLVITLFQRTLARHPSDQEIKIALEHVEKVGNRTAAFEDVLWGLLNSAEFTTRK